MLSDAALNANAKHLPKECKQKCGTQWKCVFCLRGNTDNHTSEDCSKETCSVCYWHWHDPQNSHSPKFMTSTSWAHKHQGCRFAKLKMTMRSKQLAKRAAWHTSETAETQSNVLSARTAANHEDGEDSEEDDASATEPSYVNVFTRSDTSVSGSATVTEDSSASNF
jgi:hypothetical protein